MVFFILLSFSNIFFIVLNIFLHLTHIYANSFNFFTYLKMTEDRSKRRFLSVIFTVLQSELSNSNALGTGHFLGMSNYLGALPFFEKDSLTA